MICSAHCSTRQLPQFLHLDCTVALSVADQRALSTLQGHVRRAMLPVSVTKPHLLKNKLSTPGAVQGLEAN